MATVLELVKTACYEGGIPPPQTLVGATDTSTLQLLSLFYATGRELRGARVWPQLKRRHYFDLEAGRSQYPLPDDFYGAISDTGYDSSTRWRVEPLTDAEWNQIAYGGLVGADGFQFRVFGPDVNIGAGSRGQFQVMPTPSESHVGTMLSFEYVSQTWLLPKPWAPGATIAVDDVRSVNGNIYKATVAGTTSAASTGYRGPTVTPLGVGQDGGVFWRSVPYTTWVTATPYRVGEYVQNSIFSTNGYVATTSGISGVTGPTGNGTAIIDGTIVWKYAAGPLTPTWKALTAFASGAHIIAASPPPALFYRAVTPTVNAGQLTGKLPPKWLPNGTEPDGTVTWAAQTAPYAALMADTDRCLFDDELMIAGLKWRFLRARGLEYRDLQREYEDHKNVAVSRWMPSSKISLQDGPPGCEPCYPVVPEGNWGV